MIDILRFRSSVLVVERVRKAVSEFGRFAFGFLVIGSASVCAGKRVAEDAPFRSGEGNGIELTLAAFEVEELKDRLCGASSSESSAKAMVDRASFPICCAGS